MSDKAKTVTKISIVGLVALFMTVFIYMADLAYYPAFYGTMMAFPDADMGVLNFIMTGSQLSAAVSAFLVISLMRKFSKKTLLLVCTGAFAVFGICAPLVNDVMFVAAMRTLSGFAFGGIMGVAVSLIQQVYRNNAKKRDQLVGWYNGFMSLSGTINSLAGGFLAAISWNYVFSFYWIAVPIFVLVLLFVPKTPVDGADGDSSDEMEALAAAASQPETGEGGWEGTLPKAIGAAVSFGVISLVYMACGSGQLSVIVPELGIGGEEVAGLIAAVASVAGFFAGIVFAPAFAKLGRFMPVVLFAIMAVGIGCYCMGANVVLIYVGFCLDAFSYAAGLSYYMVYAAEVVPPSKASTAITIVTIGMTLGGFISPYAVTALQTALGSAEVMPIYPVLALCIVAATVISLVLAIRSKKSGEQIVSAAEM